MRPSKVTVIIFILWAANRGSGELLDVKLFLWGFYTPPPTSLHSLSCSPPLFTHYFITTPAHVRVLARSKCFSCTTHVSIIRLFCCFSFLWHHEASNNETSERPAPQRPQLTTKFHLDKEMSVRNHQITWHSSFMVVAFWKPVRKSDRTLFIQRNVKGLVEQTLRMLWIK